MIVFPVGAVDEQGQKPFYAEECASMLAVTFSSGGNKLRSIVSTYSTQKVTIIVFSSSSETDDKNIKTERKKKTPQSQHHFLEFGTIAVTPLFFWFTSNKPSCV